MSFPVRILFAGGGTGGHLYPAIAMADEVSRRRPDSEILFVGAKGKIEERVVPAHGYRLETIRISGLSRSVSLKTVMLPLKLVMAIIQSYRLLRKWKPDVVVGTGGYVAGPALYAASMIGIPTLIQEQNSYPGITTRMLAGRVNEVHLSFEETGSHLKKKRNHRLTGNPTRAAIGLVSPEDGRAFFGLDRTSETILIFGGSQGAAAINRVVGTILPGLAGSKRQIIWQTGTADFASARTEADRSGVGDRVRIFPYIGEMENAYGAASVAICRAGASTIAELLQAGIPAILVPYPHAAADHQTRNAASLAREGAAVLLEEQDLADLEVTVRDLFADKEKMRAMAHRSRELARPDAAGDLAQAILRLAEGGRGRK